MRTQIDPEPAAAGDAPADAPLRVRLRRALPSLAVLFCATFVIAEWIDIVGSVQSPGHDGSGYLVDYVAIWAAAKLALAGTPVLAYDPAVLRIAQDLPSSAPADVLLGWFYPPHAFLVATPLGAVTFSLSFLIFSLVSLAAWVAAIWRPAGRFAEGRMWMLAAPPLAFCLVTGQPSLIWMAGLAFVLEALRDRREVAAGLVLALMTIKPQFGLLLPVALIAGGYWRAIAAGAVALALLLLAATLIVGVEAWPAFREGLSFHATLIENGNTRIHQLLGLYPFLRAVGLGHDTAASVQLMAILPFAVVVAAAWRRGSVASFDARAAVLCLASYFAAPYGQFYDALLLALGGLYWARALAEDGPLSPWARRLLAAGAAACGLVFAEGAPIALVLTPIAAVALGWMLARLARGTPHGPVRHAG